MTQKRFFKSALIISGFTLISRILGAIRDLALTHFFGASWHLDAFIQAFTIPNVFRRLTAEGSMTLAFIPVYAEIKEQEDLAAAKHFAQQVLSLVLSVTLVLTLLGVFFSEELVILFAAGFLDNPQQYELTVRLTQWMFPYLIFVSVVAWAMGVLNAEKRFATPAAAPIFLNIGIISASIWGSWNSPDPIYWVAWGVLAGGVVQVLLQWPALRSIQQSLVLKKPWGDPRIWQLLRLMGPALFGIAVYQINIIVLRNIASFLPTGQVTYYYTANRLTELAIGVFAIAISNASFPTLSENTASKDWDAATQTLKLTLTSTLLIVIPAMCGLIALAYPIVAMLYWHGAFTQEDVHLTAITLQAFALGLPAIAMVRLLVSMFYAFQDSKTTVFASTLTILVTALLGWHWSQTLEVQGLAYGLSAGTWFQVVLLGSLLHWQKGFSLSWFPLSQVLTYALLSGLMGMGVWWLSAQWTWDQGPASWQNWLVFLGIMAAAAAFYFGSLGVLKKLTQ